MWVGFVKGRIEFARSLSLFFSNLARLLAFGRFRVKRLRYRRRTALAGQSPDFDCPVRFTALDVQVIAWPQDLGRFTAILAIDPDFPLGYGRHGQ